MKICLTGKMAMNRKDESARFKRYGITVQSGITQATDYLVTGDKPGNNKLQHAKNYKVKILSEDEFFELLVENHPEYLL